MTTDDEKPPLDQLVDQAADLFVYAPIGLFFEAHSLLPKLAEQGRVHARNARMFGQFAVRHGEAQLRRRLGGLEDQAAGLLRMFGLGDDEPDVAPEPSGPTDGRTEAGATVVDAAAAPSTGNGQTPEATAAGRADDLAITDYDSLSASQVVTRLEGLTRDELEAVRAYEVAHRGRKTILNKVAQIQG
jgi:hypothetical protein